MDAEALVAISKARSLISPMMTTFFFPDPSLDALSSLSKSDDDLDDPEGVRSVTFDVVTLGVMLGVVTFLASVTDMETI